MVSSEQKGEGLAKDKILHHHLLGCGWYKMTGKWVELGICLLALFTSNPVWGFRRNLSMAHHKGANHSLKKTVRDLGQLIFKIHWRFYFHKSRILMCPENKSFHEFRFRSYMYTYLDKNMVQRDACSPKFTAALFTIGKTWKPPKRPTAEGWIKKMSCMYTGDYYSVIKK